MKTPDVVLSITLSVLSTALLASLAWVYALQPAPPAPPVQPRKSDYELCTDRARTEGLNGFRVTQLCGKPGA